MEIFFDEKYLTIQDNENYIFYFGNLNKAIKLNYYNTYCLQQIFSNITNNIIDLSMLCFIGISQDYLEKFIRYLVEKKILFLTKESLKQNIQKNSSVSCTGIKQAYLHMTQRCNLNCRYCYNKSNLNKGLRELSTGEWICVIKKLESLGVIM